MCRALILQEEIIMMLASGLVKTWMGTSLVLETTLTAITWAVQPLPFQIWSVGCLVVDAFILIRECILRPVRKNVSQYPTYSYKPQPAFNMGVLL